MNSAAGIVLMQLEAERRLAPVRAAFGRVIDYLFYAIQYDIPRVNSDAEVWE